MKEFLKNTEYTEMFGLTSQICRSIISVPANIVEEFKKKTRQSGQNEIHEYRSSFA
ncbi:MAG: four helix bundle protein [bacterium]